MSESLTIETAEPLEDHARVVMGWRNDPVTLSNSFHREPKVWDTFWPEFRDTYFRHADLPPIFVRQGTERVAFLRFQPIALDSRPGLRCCDISINVATAHRGRGLGAAVLTLASSFLAGRGIGGVLAEIRVENAPSMRAFEKAGYSVLERATKLVPDTGERCAILRYFRDLAVQTSV